MKQMQTRREFIGAGCVALAGAAAANSSAAVRPEPAFMWGVLLHFGVNIQCDLPVTQWGKYKGEDLKLMTAADHVRFDEGVFDRITDRMAAKGLNTIVMDLEEALYYPSHPELAVKGTWGVERFRRKLEQLRAKGLEPIPKLNFSTTHDIWLKEYHKMVSTPQYYRVCADVIADVIDIFDTPRYFHIGFDEETHEHQRKHSISIVRQGELWWHDFLFIVREVEKRGVRAWCWSDKIWHAKDDAAVELVLRAQFRPEPASEGGSPVQRAERLHRAGEGRIRPGTHAVQLERGRQRLLHGGVRPAAHLAPAPEGDLGRAVGEDASAVREASRGAG